MNAEIICVGTELLLGDILNTNAKYISERLAEFGINVYSQSVVGDNAMRLKNQLTLSMSRSELIILSGGLGPTPDDITKETVAGVLKLPLIEDSATLFRIENYFTRSGKKMSSNNKKQALTIKGATILENDYGTAPGYCIKHGSNTIILLPGPPSELKPMFDQKVIPILKSFSNQTLLSHNVKIFGIGESQVAELCGKMLNSKNPTVATYAKSGEVDIRVTSTAPTSTGAERISAPTIREIEKIFGENIYGIDCENLQEQTVTMLRKKGMKLATAESCTAGLLSSRITEIPGSSEVFEMGVTAYANYIKTEALGVNPELIEQKGAVCPEVAAEMAIGIRTMCNADLGLGITGVAGPGESEGKPAGLVYIALADREKVFVRKIMCRGSSRDNTRIIASSTALDMARRYLGDCKSLLDFGTTIGSPINLLEGYTLPERVAAPKVVLKTEPGKTKPAVIFSDEELFEMLTSTADPEDNVEPEKLDVENDAHDFVFEDEEYALNNEYSAASQTLISSELFVDMDDDLEDIADISSKSENGAPKKRSFFRSLFPCSEDSASEKIRKTIFLIAFIVLVGTMGYLINYFAEGWIQNKMVNDAAKVWQDDDSLKKNKDGIFVGFEDLIKANSDIKAWIKIKDTNINNPVYQTKDNDYYIKHNMNKEVSRYGALFIDMDASITPKGNNQNVVIYGHHMRDGSMFGQLKKYTDLNFYKKHAIIDFTTLYLQGEYKIFSVFITNTKPEHDGGEVFNYRHTKFASSRKFMQWISDVKQRSIINAGVDVRSTDEILTLSTCTYEFDDARLVVVARKIRPDEDASIYDTSNAKFNKNPLYPEIWYTKKGLKKPSSSNTFDESSLPQSSTDSSISSDMSSSDISSGASSSVPANGGNTGNAGGTSASKPSGTTNNSGSSKPSSASSKPSSSSTPSSSQAPKPSSSQPQNSQPENSSDNSGDTPQDSSSVENQ